MTACGKAEYTDLVRVQTPFLGTSANQAQGTLCILERYVAAAFPAFARQTVSENEHREAARCELLRELDPFIRDRDEPIRTTWDREHRLAIRALRPKDVQPRFLDVAQEHRNMLCRKRLRAIARMTRRLSRPHSDRRRFLPRFRQRARKRRARRRGLGFLCCGVRGEPRSGAHEATFE